MNSNQGLSIHVYVKSLKGYYDCELVSQLRMLCHLKRYHVSIFDARGQRFDDPIGLNKADGVIIVKDAVSNRLACDIFGERAIPSVVVSYDYYPIGIPVISSDDYLGTRLAIDELVRRGHQKIAFVGDLSKYSDRKCFEYFCEVKAEKGLATDESFYFNANDTSFYAGGQLAKDFIAKQCGATAIVFGSALLAIGFLEKLGIAQANLKAQLDCVCFDAFSMVPVLAPRLAAIDQNINLLAYRALSQIESQRNGFKSRNETVLPRMVRVKANSRDSYSEFIEGCVDLPEFSNPNYTKAVIAMQGEFQEQILDSDFDKIMCISPFFRNYIKAVVVSEFSLRKGGEPSLRVRKLCNRKEVEEYAKAEPSPVFEVDVYAPARDLVEIESESLMELNFCIHEGSQVQEVVSVCGENEKGADLSSFLMLCSMMSLIIDQYRISRNAARCDLTQQANDIVIDENATIVWDTVANATRWSPEALCALGFNESIEQKVYQNMEFIERLHPDCAVPVQRKVYQVIAERGEFYEAVKVRHKSERYLSAAVKCQSTADNPSILVFFIGVENNNVLG